MTSAKKGRDISAAAAADGIKEMQTQLADLDRAMKIEAEKRRAAESERDDLKRRLEGKLPAVLPESRELSLRTAVDDRNQLLREAKEELREAKEELQQTRAFAQHWVAMAKHHESLADGRLAVMNAFTKMPRWKRLVNAWKGTIL